MSRDRDVDDGGVDEAQEGAIVTAVEVEDLQRAGDMGSAVGGLILGGIDYGRCAEADGQAYSVVRVVVASADIVGMRVLEKR